MLSPRSIPAALLLLAAVTLAGCAGGTGSTSGAAPGAVAPSTEYYYGTSTTTSPDGKVPYGPPIMTLLKRELQPEEGLITEVALRDGRVAVVRLEHDGDARFTAVAGDNTAEGPMEFSGGSEWEWERWTFSLELADGTGVIEGSGHFDGRFLETDRYFIATSGERRTRTTDRLARITKEEYERRLTEMTASRSTGRRR